MTHAQMPPTHIPPAHIAPAHMTSQRSTPLYLAGFALLGLSWLMLGSSLETFRLGAGVSKDQIGIMFTTGAIGYFGGSMFSGWALKRHQAHPIFGYGMFICAAALVALGFAKPFGFLLALQAVLGFGAGLVDVTGNAVILWVHKGGAVMNALHLCFGIGATIAPVLVGRSLAWTDGLATGYLIVAALLVGLGVVSLLRPSPPNPHEAEAKGFPPGTGKPIALTIVFFVFYVGIEVGFIGWILEYGVARGFERAGAATWLATGFLAAFTLGRLISIPIGSRVSPFRVLIADATLCVIGLTILLVGGTAPAAVWLGTIIFGLGTASMFPTMLSLAEPVVPSTSSVTSAFLIGASGGSMLIPWLIGVLLERRGAGALPAVVLAGTLVCTVVVFAVASIGRAHYAAEN